ncbi:hypothetical protein C0992_008532, partial [Termitomyces sp. T32_za158]
PTPMVARYPTPSTRQVLLSPCPPPPYPLNPTHSPGTGSTNVQDYSTALLLANDPRSTGTWVPPIIPTTLEYSPADSLRPHLITGTLFPLPAPDLLLQEPTMPAPVPPVQHDPFQHSRPLALPPACTPPFPLAHRQSIAEC